MRKTILALMAVSAITFVGCEKERPVTNTIEGTKVGSSSLLVQLEMLLKKIRVNH